MFPGVSVSTKSSCKRKGAFPPTHLTAIILCPPALSHPFYISHPGLILPPQLSPSQGTTSDTTNCLTLTVFPSLCSPSCGLLPSCLAPTPAPELSQHSHLRDGVHPALQNNPPAKLVKPFNTTSGIELLKITAFLTSYR